MQVLNQAGQLILALSILVFIHEMGHFLAAKAFGIKVDKFYIFFDAWGKKLFSVKYGETEYGIGWLPLGGYVKIAGMIDESMDKEAMKLPPESWEFRSKPNWQKLIVMVAGVVMNVILGSLLYAFYLNHYVKDYIPTAEFNKDGIYAHESARQFGFETGDRLLEVKGKPMDRWEDFVSLKVFFGGDVTVDRNGEKKIIDVPGDFFKSLQKGRIPFLEPKNQVFVDEFKGVPVHSVLKEGDQIVSFEGADIFCFGELQTKLGSRPNDTVEIGLIREGSKVSYALSTDSLGRLGFIPNIDYDYEKKAYSPGVAINYGIKDAWSFLYYNAVGFTKMDREMAGSIQSPVGIAKLFDPSWNWAGFWRLTAILSMILAFMNILPIPALDGGHIMFIGIEMIMGRKLSDTFMERAQLVGMVIILGLMALAFSNDIRSLL